jgi:cytochrome c556
MKKSILALCLVALMPTLAADREYDAIMKDVGKACGDLKKNLEAKDLTTAGANAKELQGLFKEVQAFWKARNTESALQAANGARRASGAIAKAAAANSQADADEQFKTLLGSCKACHDAHREKGADGKWKIKS